MVPGSSTQDRRGRRSLLSVANTGSNQNSKTPSRRRRDYANLDDDDGGVPRSLSPPSRHAGRQAGDIHQPPLKSALRNHTKSLDEQQQQQQQVGPKSILKSAQVRPFLTPTRSVLASGLYASMAASNQQPSLPPPHYNMPGGFSSSSSLANPLESTALLRATSPSRHVMFTDGQQPAHLSMDERSFHSAPVTPTHNNNNNKIRLVKQSPHDIAARHIQLKQKQQLEMMLNQDKRNGGSTLLRRRSQQHQLSHQLKTLERSLSNTAVPYSSGSDVFSETDRAESSDEEDMFSVFSWGGASGTSGNSGAGRRRGRSLPPPSGVNPRNLSGGRTSPFVASPHRDGHESIISDADRSKDRSKKKKSSRASRRKERGHHKKELTADEKRSKFHSASPTRSVTTTQSAPVLPSSHAFFAQLVEQRFEDENLHRQQQQRQITTITERNRGRSESKKSSSSSSSKKKKTDEDKSKSRKKKKKKSSKKEDEQKSSSSSSKNKKSSSHPHRDRDRDDSTQRRARSHSPRRHSHETTTSTTPAITGVPVKSTKDEDSSPSSSVDQQKSIPTILSSAPSNDLVSSMLSTETNSASWNMSTTFSTFNGSSSESQLRTISYRKQQQQQRMMSNSSAMMQ